jgi:hypothetical protein
MAVLPDQSCRLHSGFSPDPARQREVDASDHSYYDGDEATLMSMVSWDISLLQK